MLSQIKYDKISLSKYKFKENISTIRLIAYIGTTIFFLASILMWILKEEAVMFLKNICGNYNNSNFIYLSRGMFFLAGRLPSCLPLPDCPIPPIAV